MSWVTEDREVVVLVVQGRVVGRDDQAQLQRNGFSTVREERGDGSSKPKLRCQIGKAAL